MASDTKAGKCLELEVLPPTISQKTAHQGSKNSLQYMGRRLVVLFVALGLGCYFTNILNEYAGVPALGRNRSHQELCLQPDILVPEKNGAVWKTLGAEYGTEEFKSRAIDWLAGAVRIPTESFDYLGPADEDPHWKVFDPLHSYLVTAFPNVHAALQLTKVNTYGLLYTWPGSDKTLKPILLLAHQDVVPVEPSTVDEWTHPPYSGYFDGENVWGRGSSDDKSGVIGILSSIEGLLEKGFQPTRTVVLSFGFDEEVSGTRGAKTLAPAIKNIYGKDGVAFIVDEGGGFSEQYGTVFAMPGIAEKGYFDVTVEVTSPGGHSSVPPKHTSIGILSALLVHYEANPFKARLTRKDPLYSTYQCIAEHGTELSSSDRRLIKRAAHSNSALHDLGKILFKERVYESLVGTTQAIDIIRGGVKANALPERASTLINHRIAVISSVNETKSHIINLLEPLGKEFDLAFTAWGEEFFNPDASYKGTLTLSDAYGTALEPAPVTPTSHDAIPYKLLSGTIKATYNSHRSLEGNHNIIVSPSMPSGNTDTRYYWALSEHIFRYNHQNSGRNKNRLSGGVHTVNEHIAIDAFLEKIRFFTTLILNADEATNI